MKKMYFVLPMTGVWTDEAVAKAAMKGFTVYNEALDLAKSVCKQYNTEFKILETRSIIKCDIVIYDLNEGE